ncbi:hypothetical protein ACRYCC_38650 [Actinomadura scrupuli]|uniref:hypothetical protein n=1 Tax=Actinomadura scrupuli TaxID=559629 RepID=UPI003D975C05
MRTLQEPETSPATWNDDVESSLLAGEQALRVEGNLQAGRSWFDTAYRQAERWGDGQGMARAALGLAGLWVHENRTAADIARVRVRQRDALRMIDPRSSLALRLRIRMVAEDDYRVGEHMAILAMVAEARRAGDTVALVEALSLAHHCLMGPEHAALRSGLAQELIGEASRTNRRSDLLMALLWHAVDLLLCADPHAERCLEELRVLLAQGDHLAIGFVLGTIEVMLHIRAGRFDRAEALAATCAERGAAAGDITATGWYTAQLGTIRWYQGRVAELVPAFTRLLNSPMLSALDNACHASLAVAAATAGDRRLAASALARLRGRVLADQPRSGSWLMSMYGVVEVAHLLGDTETAAQAYTLLSPFAHLPVMLCVGVVCLGSVHHSLGVAALTTGDLDRSIEHLHAAVHDNLALGNWPAVVLSRSRLGQALALRDGPLDEAARRELALAEQEAAALGMQLPADATREPASLTGRTGEHGGRAPVVCRRRGRQWQVALGGRTTLVDHCVGMRHLAALLSNPGYEIPATELAAGPGAPETAMVQGAVTSTQPVLDDVAKRQYKQRLAELQAEIDDFEAMNEVERAAAVRTERDWLVAELASAAGMGGRVRQFTGSEERARIAVGKAIRRAVQRVTDADPVIGNELRATVQTGLRCCYRPR